MQNAPVDASAFWGTMFLDSFKCKDMELSKIIKMKINEQKVKQVRDGVAAIKYVSGEDNAVQLNEIANCVKNPKQYFDGLTGYYYLNNHGNWWFADDATLEGLTSIPLKEFFEQDEEESDCHICGGEPVNGVAHSIECTLWAGNPKRDKEEVKPDCSRHKKEVAGISDMKVLAEMIGDLHYETLTELLDMLSVKLFHDSELDLKGGREKLSNALYDAASHITDARERIDDAWEISKPFMTSK